MKHEQNLVWLDCEMTGLDLEKDVILEAACIVTDANLNVVAQCPNLVISHADHVLQAMGPWCQKQHKKSGLIFDVQLSQLTMAEAQQTLLEFLTTYCFEKKAPLCGSSIWVDRIFLKKDMPLVHDFLHYRNVDVASVKELVQRWYIFDLEKDLPKKELHRAMSDVYESLNEMKYYRDNFFVPATKT